MACKLYEVRFEDDLKWCQVLMMMVYHFIKSILSWWEWKKKLLGHYLFNDDNDGKPHPLYNWGTASSKLLHVAERSLYRTINYASWSWNMHKPCGASYKSAWFFRWNGLLLGVSFHFCFHGFSVFSFIIYIGSNLLVKAWDFEASGVIWTTLSLHHIRGNSFCACGEQVVIRISIFLFFAQVIWLSCLRRTCNRWLNDHVLSGKLRLSSEPPILLLWKNRYLDHLSTLLIS